MNSLKDQQCSVETNLTDVLLYSGFCQSNGVFFFFFLVWNFVKDSLKALQFNYISYFPAKNIGQQSR